MTRWRPVWQPTAHRGRLLTVALTAVLLAGLAGRAPLLVLAAPLLVLAVSTGRRPSAVTVDVTAGEVRCLEGDPVTVVVTVSTGVPVDQLTFEWRLPDSFLLDPALAALRTDTSSARLRWHVTPLRWGRYHLGPGRLTLLAAGRTVQAELWVTGPEVAVYPRSPALPTGPRPAQLRHQGGEHPVAAPGGGVEFVGIRPYQPGDQVRQVNWAATSRHGRLFVNERADERGCDLVLVVDALSDVGGPPETTLDRAIRAAAGLARGYLRGHDRVGIVALGGFLRWLRPGLGERHFYEIVEAVLDVRSDESYVDPDVSRIPRVVLPPGALVVLLSPLLDPRATSCVRDLRVRGFPVAVVDLLATEPTATRAPSADLALRLWRLDRQMLLDSLTGTGALLLDGTAPDRLATALAAARHSPLARGLR